MNCGINHPPFMATRMWLIRAEMGTHITRVPNKAHYTIRPLTNSYTTIEMAPTSKHFV